MTLKLLTKINSHIFLFLGTEIGMSFRSEIREGYKFIVYGAYIFSSVALWEKREIFTPPPSKKKSKKKKYIFRYLLTIISTRE